MLKLSLIAAAASALFSAALTWHFSDAYWQAKWDEAEQGRLKNEIRTVTKTVYIEREAAAKTAEADRQGQKELLDAQAEIKRLRADLAAGTRRLRGQTAACPASNPSTARAGTGMDTERHAGQRASAANIEPHILDLGEHALTAIAQRDACVQILQSDRALLSAQ